jgi:hypothetical protein
MPSISSPRFDYLSVIRRLPPPTDEQTRAFAEFVSDAHSWYKHLPLFPGRPFCFFLDPNAGRQLIYNPDDTVEWRDIPEGESLFHYSTRVTATYRRTLGFWNYYAPYGTSFLLPSEQGLASTESTPSRRADADDGPPGPAIYHPDAGGLRVPTDLVREGTVDLSALVSSWRNFMMYRMHSVSGKESTHLLQRTDDLRFDGLPADVGECLMQVRSLLIQGIKIPLQYDDHEVEERLKDDRWYDLPAPYHQQFLDIVNTLRRERQRQIDAMVAAMQRLKSLAYQDPPP